MSNNNQKHCPPTLPMWLLNLLLPDSVKDDITGDLTEEYSRSTDTLLNKNKWFWSQTISTCWRFTMTKQNLASLGLAIISILTLGIIMHAILFLSVADDPASFHNAYWTDGNFHQFFFDAPLWQFISENNLSRLSFDMFIHLPSMAWLAIALCGFIVLKKQLHLSFTYQLILAASLLMLPYIGGVTYFRLTDVALNQAGPILALMLISAFYLILPFTHLLLKELKSVDL
ncbi:hypothetical protein OPS25_07460 [Alteromonas ponticola]|uniref:DUF2079 domain-containing protein n=1 Tax=Alteromonas aquimaris TaxID=2998417 RepID=A0ABT3P6D7_9ALTE|nr:hypothetical protein [Alteromonas aquimaris]MCW8108329.1 hypothetical protein [Alteromonas aquimaris]